MFKLFKNEEKETKMSNKEKFKLRILVASLIFVLLVGFFMKIAFGGNDIAGLEHPQEFVGNWETFSDEHLTVLKFTKKGYIKFNGKKILIWGIKDNYLFITPKDPSVVGADEPMVVAYEYSFAPDNSYFVVKGMRNDGQEIELKYTRI